jgi:hypothetical protein
MSVTKTNKTEMTCDLSDVVDFIGSAFQAGAAKVKVVIDGAEWTVIRGGPKVMFEYKGEALIY